ncbi:ssDNA binding protein [Mycobacterium phage Indlulamithi]|uniref:Uncharacterized protein n=1 Tax=Mycobacterium phage Indlulamithi TaxID=2656582 RepID=A0A649VDA3_9CAUD|nr:ssDNA binding protein [Mycobacterium phage Indlulamithi]QGJ90055.1 hypothetical protein PBI_INDLULAMITHI_14 [Mycobacterium phage Indlulamithi]
MSRRIENDHPWTDEEIQYQLDRGRQYAVDQNRKQFPPNATQEKDATPDDEQTPEIDQELYLKVKNMEIDDVKAELKSAGLPVTGELKELKLRLFEHLSGQKSE